MSENNSSGGSGPKNAASALALLNQKFPIADVVAGIKCERAIKWELTIGDDLTPKWKHSIVCVSIEKAPFAKGSCRTAHKLKDWSEPDNQLVGKFSTNKKTTRDSYFTDVLMQTFCSKWADNFNEAKPPKPITFLPSYVYELIDHPPPYPVCGGEPFIEGDYQKHNNNSGYVNSDARNTPQAFSHFSYEHSNHELLIVDIQGVNDFYTDPQIHTKTATGFGEGNLGETGFHKFLQTHKCNAVCDYLKLKPIGVTKKQILRGTLPVVQLMEFHDAIGIGQGQGQGQSGQPKGMDYFRNGSGAQQPISLDDEEKLLQEQLERIRAQQKLKQAPQVPGSIPKQPSNSNLNVHKPKPQAQQPTSPTSPSQVQKSATNNNPTTPSTTNATSEVKVENHPQPQQPQQPQPQPQPQQQYTTPPQQPQQPQPVSIQIRSSPPQESTNSSVNNNNSGIKEAVPDKSSLEKWDLKSTALLDTIRGLQSECITGDDLRLYTGSNDGQLGIWDAKELKHVTNIRAHLKSIRSVTKKPSSENIVFSAGADCFIKEWDMNTQQTVKEIKEASDVNTIFIQDNLLYTGCNDKTVKVWDLRTYECIKTLNGHSRAIKSVCSTGNLIFSGSNDQQIYVWNFQTGKILTNFQGHEGWVKTLYSHNNYLYSGSHDETIKVWDLKTTKCINTIKCKDRVETLHVTNQGIFAGSGDFLQIFNTDTYENLSTINTKSSILCLWRRQNQLYTGSLASNLKVFNWSTQ